MNSNDKQRKWQFKLGQVILLYLTGIVFGAALILVVTRPDGQSPIGSIFTAVGALFTAAGILIEIRTKATNRQVKESTLIHRGKEGPT
jgi:protein-S-isoprenylcysteine O-methyltransferase Ste14